jgi:hypothetical protein
MSLLRRVPKVFRRGITVGLPDVEEHNVMIRVREILDGCGLSSLEEIRRVQGLPEGRWMVFSEPSGGKGVVESPILALAVLSLSSSVFFDRRRPIVATPGRLTRNLVLYKPLAFYGH